MTNVLPSYLVGTWVRGEGAGVLVTDAVTGEDVCRVTSGGLDIAAAVAYGRQIGGPALRAMTFGERASAVKAAAVALSDHAEELYALSARAGSTRADSKVDIDGGFGTALVFASLGRKGLPETGFALAEDAPIALGREGRFLGQHILTPRRGVAVEINAFNFPVWGMIEKLAPAILAGVASIVKPATPTSYITQRAVEIILESGAFPEGALQFVAGSIPGLFDVLDGRDSVAFTGSARTAAALRSHTAFTARSARFTAEADSLNSSVLGPDAAPGSPEFDLYVDQLVAEMTTKAGQRCTCIRRAFVPALVIDAVTEAVSAKLAAVVVGAPGVDGVTMGALVSTEHREDVRAQIDRIASEGRLVFGDPSKVHVQGADAEVGAFLSPILFRADGNAAAPHEVEAFGPVTTLMAYDGTTTDAVALVERGEGSLVASVVSADSAFVRDTVLGIAHQNGRVLVLDRDSAPESTGHGTPMPQLIHGGPGRAGGGEEVGGLRAVHHHMQRTAVQGGPSVLATLTGHAC